MTKAGKECTLIVSELSLIHIFLAANELLTFAKRYAQDIEITEESIGYDLIKKIGIGGNYLPVSYTHLSPTLLNTAIIELVPESSQKIPEKK